MSSIRLSRSCIIFLLAITGGTMLLADEAGRSRPTSQNESSRGRGWYHRFDAAFSHQFDASVDTGGDAGAHRFISRASIGYRTDYANSTALSIGYSRDNYDLDPFGTLLGTRPWNEIDTLNAGIAIRRQLSDQWSLLAIPTLRVAAEDESDFSDAVTGGAIVGFSYAVNPRLSIGPGLGVLTQLEDQTSYFPVILIRWQIASDWTLETGRGLGASMGPGLLLTHALKPSWDIQLGGRFERRRFRLDNNGTAPNGIGEDRNGAVYIGLRHSWAQTGSVTLYGGVNFAGQLRIDDARGNTITESDYDSAATVGLSAQIGF